MRTIASLTASERSVDPESIAQVWAEGSLDDAAHVDVEVRPADNGGWVAEAVAYTGDGPFERLGTANAIITASGRLMACTR
jgi:hypothetical protein